MLLLKISHESTQFVYVLDTDGIVHRNSDSTDGPVSFERDHSFLRSGLHEILFECLVPFGATDAENCVHATATHLLDRCAADQKESCRTSRSLQLISLEIIFIGWGGVRDGCCHSKTQPGGVGAEINTQLKLETSFKRKRNCSTDFSSNEAATLVCQNPSHTEPVVSPPTTSKTSCSLSLSQHTRGRIKYSYQSLCMFTSKVTWPLHQGGQNNWLSDIVSNKPPCLLPNTLNTQTNRIF